MGVTPEIITTSCSVHAAETSGLAPTAKDLWWARHLKPLQCRAFYYLQLKALDLHPLRKICDGHDTWNHYNAVLFTCSWKLWTWTHCKRSGMCMTPEIITMPCFLIPAAESSGGAPAAKDPHRAWQFRRCRSTLAPFFCGGNQQGLRGSVSVCQTNRNVKWFL